MRNRPWSETEKLGAIVVAVREGVPEASRRLKVPQRTIYQWVEAAGGVAEIRHLANMRAEEALSAAVAALCYEAVRRAKTLKDDQLMITLRAIIETARAPAGDGGNQVAAAAQAHVWNINIAE